MVSKKNNSKKRSIYEPAGSTRVSRRKIYKYYKKLIGGAGPDTTPGSVSEPVVKSMSDSDLLMDASEPTPEPETKSVTEPETKSVTEPETKPLMDASEPMPEPETKSVTEPETKPLMDASEPMPEPETKPLMDASEPVPEPTIETAEPPKDNSIVGTMMNSASEFGKKVFGTGSDSSVDQTDNVDQTNDDLYELDEPTPTPTLIGDESAEAGPDCMEQERVIAEKEKVNESKDAIIEAKDAIIAAKEEVIAELRKEIELLQPEDNEISPVMNDSFESSSDLSLSPLSPLSPLPSIPSSDNTFTTESESSPELNTDLSGPTDETLENNTPIPPKNPEMVGGKRRGKSMKKHRRTIRRSKKHPRHRVYYG
jgi:hypothetical protein